MKLICNECYVKELNVHDYDGKLYADACECQQYNLHEYENEIQNHRQDAYDQGYIIGYEDGLFEKGDKENL